jgi:hypothetical protein
MRSGSLIILATALFAVSSQVLGANYYLLGITMMISMFAIGLAYRGWPFALRCLVFQFIIFLSFPKVGEVVNATLHTTGLAPILVAKTLLALAALALFKPFSKSLIRPPVPHRPSAPWAALITAAAAVTLFGQLYLARANDATAEYTYYLPYLIGQNAKWEGFDISDGESLVFYERGNIINRQYVNNGRQVGVMIVPSDGNRKTIHTPEYCQTGMGWEVLDSRTVRFNDWNGQPARAKKLLLKNKENGMERTFLYWFGDSDGTYVADYPVFIITDTLRKFRGKKTNWILHVVWSDTGPAAVLDLIGQIPPVRSTPVSPVKN